MNLPETAKLQEIYGETEKSSARFKKLADNFAKTYLSCPRQVVDAVHPTISHLSAVHSRKPAWSRFQLSLST